MELSRRDFLKASGVGIGGIFLLGALSDGVALASPIKRIPLIKKGQETSTICPYDASGCGFIVMADASGKIINIEGDPDHPINRGAACARGSALRQLSPDNPWRLSKVLYRAPGGTDWQEKDWNWALDTIARRIKDTRDTAFTGKDEDGNIVNRTEAIASLGGSALDNEECYLLAKLTRALGVVYLEHQTRIGHSVTVASLEETLGRGAMTNHWNDIANADVIMAIGANPAESHPVAFGHITTAMERGARLISVDPRFTRTSAKADIYCPLRSGTDIAFINGLIKYVLDDIEANPGNYNLAYITEYTNASHLINPGYQGPAELDGLFSGYDGAKKSYNRSTWQYQLDENGLPGRDKTLKDHNCAFQILKRHMARYTPEMVSRITGCPVDTFLLAAQAYAASGAAGRSGTILYATGTTQHTCGTQNIRAYGILQLLLANIGIAGGGINAMRDESNAQGATDHCLLSHMLPGYLAMPANTDTSREAYLKRLTPATKDPNSANWWSNYPRYIVSLLKAWYGDAATKDNDFSFHCLPKVQPGQDYTHIALFEAMDKGIIKGLMVWGQNPAVGGPDANLERKAMERLDWMVVSDIWQTETANFWKRPGADTANIKTEVFLLPAVGSFEKEGSVTNSGRWMQWRYKAVNGPGDARDDLWMLDQLARRLMKLYAEEGGPGAGAIAKLNWSYGDDHPDVHAVAREINGYDLTTGKLIASSAALKDDGTTSSGNWLYCASYTEDGNMAARRDLTHDPFNIGLYPEWAWCWPMNSRIIYNRVSVDLNGEPWDKEHPVIKWNPAEGASGGWDGDVPDGNGPPMAVDPEGTRWPFIMKPEGFARVFGMGLADGPLPEHYEPWESPVANTMSAQQNNPTVKVWRPEEQGDPGKYPIVASIYRLGEHWQGGQMTRNLPWIIEAQPEPFCEMGEELAAEKGIANGDRVIVASARGQVNVVALVTRRFKPFQMNGRRVHQIGVIWHWGYTGLSRGDSANVLTPHVGDPNTTIPEFKAFLVNIRKA